jgi:ParB-like chromosome segregation protein Spo0J
VDRNNKIVGGHGRYCAAQSLGLTEVPVIRLEHLTEAQAKAFRIADNRLTETSVWDDRLLAESLKELSELDLDFSLEATGFEMSEIDFRIEGITADSDGGDTKADALPPACGQPAVTERGDIWLLSQHRVCCDNALEITNLDPSRRKYGSRVQCRVGDRSQHKNRDVLRPNLHWLARDEQ